MRWWLVGVGLWLTVVLVVPDVQAGGRPPNPEGEEGHRGKRKRDGKGRTREGRSRPLKIRLVPGPNIPEKPAANQGSSGFLNVYRSTKDQQSSYSVIPVPNDPSEAVVPLTQEEIQKILWREEVEHREEEERLRKKDEARRKRRKERKEQEEIQRKIVERKRRKEEEALRLQVEKEEEWRKQIEEAEERRRQEEQIRREEEERKNKEKEALEKERKLKEERRKREEIQRKEAEEQQSEAEEKEVWLRGDVFQMTPKEPDLLPVPIPIPPAVTEEQEETELGEENLMTRRSGGAGLPLGCDISDVTLTCENAQLRHFPPLSISELKSLSLEGNNITTIPAGAFNGIPNLEWINLKKNKLTSAGIDANTFKGLKMLRRLYLDENLLDTMPPNLPPTLQELKINENKLRRIDENSFQDLSSLVILELEGNMLSEGNVDPKAFTPLKELSYLRLGRNHFRMVPQGLPRSLLELYLENNLIEEISETAFNQTSNLNVVSLRHNKLDETMIAPMAWFNHRNLESIDLSHNKLYLVPSFLPKSLVHLVLVGNRIERIPGFVFAHMDPGLEYLYLSFNKLDGEGVEPESFFGVYHTMTEMCLDHNQLIHVPVGISEMTNLHFLRLDNNQIRSISDESICDPNHSGEATLVGVRIENNYIDPQKVSPTAFSCVRSASSVVLKPQKTK